MWFKYLRHLTKRHSSSNTATQLQVGTQQSQIVSLQQQLNTVGLIVLACSMLLRK
jgi:hypothetical protein